MDAFDCVRGRGDGTLCGASYCRTIANFDRPRGRSRPPLETTRSLSIHRSIDPSSVRIAVKQAPPGRIAGSIIKPTTVATGTGLGEVSFETIGAVEYEYSIQCYDKDNLDAADEFLTCLPLGGKLDFDEAGLFLIAETNGTTEVGKSTTTWAFGDALADADKTAQCFIFTEGPYGKLDKCMSAGEAVLEEPAPSPNARLFATVQKPTVEADFVDGDITVSWKTGPAFVDGSYTVSCYEVLLGADPITCKNLEDNELSRVAVAEGDYDKTLLKDDYTEVLSYAGSDGEIVQCFIEVEGEYGHERCKEAGEATFEAPAPTPAPTPAPGPAPTPAPAPGPAPAPAPGPAPGIAPAPAPAPGIAPAPTP